MRERVVMDLRPLGIREVPMLGRYEYREAKSGLPPHAHRHVLEICYLARGQQLYRVGRRDYVLRGGDVFVTFPGEIHSTGETPEEKGTLYWAQFILPRRPRCFLHCDPRDSRALVRQLTRLPHRHFAGEPMLGRLWDEVIAAYDRPADPLRRVTIQIRLLDLLLRVIALARHQPRAGISSPISDLLRYIETNIHQTLPLAALAARLGLSLPRFKARFKQEVGIPPAEYVLRRKIAAARDRLARPGATVTRVATELNFCSPQYFATVFRRFAGQTPEQFRAGFPA